MKENESKTPKSKAEEDLDMYQSAYHIIDEKYPNFWKWAVVVGLVVAFLFVLPYLLSHTSKTLNACKDLKVSVKNLKS
jgi:hypothetical protein